MSADEEMPEDMGGMGGMGDDMSHDGGDGDYMPPPELPEGIAKEILAPAPSDNWKTPKPGDEVEVHYVGTLESDGSEFDSSRGRGEPFKFTLGKGQVIKGWDKGVATMKRGELAKFTLAPEFAYGEAGSPPKIPEKATLVFEVELLGWTSNDDLFGDEGVIKSCLKEGDGWKMPKAGDEVLMSMKAVAADGTVIEEKANVEYELGSATFGILSKAVDKALTGMKKGEQASVKCSKDYAYGDERPEGATIELSMAEIYEIKDVSLAKDKSIMKKQVRQGEGYDMPKDCAKVKLLVDAAADEKGSISGFTAKVLDFTCGNGEVCDLLECIVLEMKKGERAIVTCLVPELATEGKLTLDGTGKEKVMLTVEMQEFVNSKETWDMSDEDKVEFGEGRKDVGASLFKSGRVRMALQRYSKVVDLFSYIDNFKEGNKAKAMALKKACELNSAACQLKLKEYPKAKTACSNVLKDDRDNSKALYRRAQADYGLKNFEDSMRDLKRLIVNEPQNRDARALLKQAQAAQKEEDKKSQGLFQNMCKALGKGPIPAPGKSTDLDADVAEVETSAGEEDAAPMNVDNAAVAAPPSEEPLKVEAA